MQDVVEWLKANGNLKIIDEPLDVELEIPHVAYIEVKTDDSRPILFTKPINKAKGIEYDMPVLMNIFANKPLTEKIFGKHPDLVAEGIDDLLKLKPPKGLKAKLAMIPKLFSLKNVFPKRLKFKGECQEVIIPKADVDYISYLYSKHGKKMGVHSSLWGRYIPKALMGVCKTSVCIVYSSTTKIV